MQRSATDIEIPPLLALAISAVLVALIAIGDLVTGPYLVFATFYLVPVALSAWFVSRNAALVMALAAAASGVVSTALDPGEVTAPVYLWNGTFRFLTFAFVAVVVAAERQAKTTIAELAAIDPLTQVLNRRQFATLGEVALANASRRSQPLAVLYLDLDGLKERNDTLGHEAGDAMLVDVARLAREAVRSTDPVARLGGDEFCIMMPGIDADQAGETAERLILSLREDAEPPISVSIGVVAGPVGPDATIEQLLGDADQLMLAAKRAGKGQVRIGTISR